MRSRGIRPNIITYSSLARPFAHRGDWIEVETIMQQMTSEGLAVNEYFLYVLLLAYATAKPRQPERAEAAFLQACSNRVKINKHVTSVLSRAVGSARCQKLLQSTGNARGLSPTRSPTRSPPGSPARA